MPYIYDLATSTENNSSILNRHDYPFNTIIEEAQDLSIHEVVEFDENEPIDWEHDIIIYFTEEALLNNQESSLQVYGAYKRVAQKVHPVSGIFPEDAQVTRQFPENPLNSLPELTPNPPEFIPSERLTMERVRELDINSQKFLWPEEEKLFLHILKLNEATLPFEEKDRGTLRQDYFSDYIMPTISHTL